MAGKRSDSRPAQPAGAALGVTVFGAGLVALVFEVLWVRSFGLVFGASTYAVSTVLAAYMAGLALGSYVVGRWAAGAARPAGSLVRAYAGIIAAIGLTGWLVTIAIPGLAAAAAPVLRFVGWNSGFGVAARGLLGFGVMLVPAALAGGLLPLAAHLSVREGRTVGRRLGVLYSLNTAGSVAGAVATGFLLIERLGVRGTSHAALLLSIVLAGLAFAGLRRPPEVRPGQPDRRVAEGRRVHYPPLSRLVLVLGFALSGFAALGYEVIWSRALITTLGLPVYGVTTMLAAFLLGLALGSALAGRMSDRWRDPLLAFGVVELSIAAAGLLTLVFLSRSAAILDRVAGWTGGSWGTMILGLAGFGLGVMLLPTLLMGATFPIASRAYLPEAEKVGLRIGLLGAANTGGALAGSIAAGFVLVPLLGTAAASVVLALASAAAGAAAVLASRASVRNRILVLAASAVVVGGIAVLAAPHRLRVLPPPVLAGPGEWRVTYYRETVDGIVTSAENRQGVRQTWVNSAVVCGSALPALKPVRLMGVIPFALHPQPRGILVIGYGLGVTASLLVSLGDQEVDCVEIAPAVVEASHGFAEWNNRVFDDSRLKLIPGDGRNYLLCTEKRYDVISCDPTHPALGSGALYTREFYELCRRRLRPGGVMTHYVPLHKLETEDFRALLHTFRSAFPECALWRGISHGVLVGRKDQALRLDYTRMDELFRTMPAGVRQALAEVFIDGPIELAGGLVLDARGVAAVSAGAAVMRDDLPGAEFAGARAGDTRTWVANAALVLGHFTGPGAVVENLGVDSARVQAEIGGAGNAERARFEATAAAVRGDRAGQVRWFEEALRWHPGDREAEMFLQMSRR